MLSAANCTGLMYLKIVEGPISYYKWESQYYYATFDWELINAVPYECTTETYLQSLQVFFILIFEFLINCTPLHILLGIPNNDNSFDGMIL